MSFHPLFKAHANNVYRSQLVWKCIAAGIVVDDPDIKIPFERYFTLPSNGGPAIPPIVQTSVKPALFRNPGFVRTAIPGMTLAPL